MGEALVGVEGRRGARLSDAPVGTRCARWPGWPTMPPMLGLLLALNLTVHAGPADCPDALALRAAVEARLTASEQGGPDSPSARFTVTFQATAAGRQAVIAGAGVRRILEVRGPDCPALADAVALALALAVAPVPEALPLALGPAVTSRTEPDASNDPRDPAPGAEPDPTDPQRQAVAGAGGPAASGVAGEAGDGAAARGPGVVPTFGVAVGAGAAPAPAVEYRPGLELRFGTLRLAVDALIQPPRATSEAGGGAEITRYGGALRGCLAPWEAVSFCGGTTAAWWRARGTGFATNEEVDTLYLALSARAAGRILQVGGFEVSAFAEGLLHPGRFRLQADGATVFASDRFGVLGGLAVGWRFGGPPLSATDSPTRAQTGG